MISYRMTSQQPQLRTKTAQQTQLRPPTQTQTIWSSPTRTTKSTMPKARKSLRRPFVALCRQRMANLFSYRTVEASTQKVSGVTSSCSPRCLSRIRTYLISSCPGSPRRKKRRRSRRLLALTQTLASDPRPLKSLLVPSSSPRHLRKSLTQQARLTRQCLMKR